MGSDAVRWSLEDSGLRCTAQRYAVTVSYTHLDVYKRQQRPRR